MNILLMNIIRLLSVTAALCFVAGAAATTAQPVEVSVSAEERIVERVRVSGTVTSPQSASLSSSVSGLIAEHSIEAGQRVNSGDKLFQLDAELEEITLSRAQANRQEAEANLANAKRRLSEAERLASNIAETEIEDRRTAVIAGEAALSAAMADESLQAAVVSRHTIRAPFTGVIVQRHSEQGEWVNPGDVLAELISIDDLWFDFPVPQNYYPRVTENTRVSVIVEALGAENSFEAEIVAVVPVKSPGARTFLLRARADAAGSLPVTPGMSARAVLSLDTGRTAVTIPRDALLRYPDGRQTVWVLENGEAGLIVNEQLVSTGLEFDARVEIRSGLKAGDRVVTRGNESLQPGQRVAPRQ